MMEMAPLGKSSIRLMRKIFGPGYISSFIPPFEKGGLGGIYKRLKSP
jgi:hypothetical protein